MARTWGRKKERFSKTKGHKIIYLFKGRIYPQSLSFKPWYFKVFTYPFYVIDLLDWTTKWLTNSSSPDSPSSSSMTHSSHIGEWTTHNFPFPQWCYTRGTWTFFSGILAVKSFQVGTYVRIFLFVLYSIPLLEHSSDSLLFLPHQTLLMNRIWLWDMDSQLKQLTIWPQSC